MPVLAVAIKTFIRAWRNNLRIWGSIPVLGTKLTGNLKGNYRKIRDKENKSEEESVVKPAWFGTMDGMVSLKIT